MEEPTHVHPEAPTQRTQPTLPGLNNGDPNRRVINVN